MTSVTTLGSQELSYLSGMSATQGYQLLNKTMKQAVTNFEKTPQVQSDISYFESTVPKLKTVNDFIGNTRLVNFVLSAFGLDSEKGYQGLIKQVLTQDPNSKKSLVNQLTDPRFKQLATALDFYDDGLGKIQALGLAAPTGATSVEGIALAAKGAATSGAIGVGIGIKGSDYLVVQKTDGTTAYTKSGYFTLNKDNQLALPDGSLLKPALIFPADTTAVTLTASGVIYAQETGQKSPTNIGSLEAATFQNPAQLSKDKSGYLTPTSSSGSPVVSFLSGKAYVFSQTNQALVNSYVQGEFETAVGTNNTAVREALYFQRTVAPDIKAAGTKISRQADTILGDTVLADVSETLLGQPKQIAYEQLSRQEQIIETGIQLNKLQSPSYVAQLTSRYLTTYDATHQASGNGANSAALQILNAFSGGGSSSSGSSVASLFHAVA